MDYEDISHEKPGRPKASLRIEEVLELRDRGCSCRGIVMILDSRGTKTSKSTIQRLLKGIEA